MCDLKLLIAEFLSTFKLYVGAKSRDKFDYNPKKVFADICGSYSCLGGA